MKPFAEVLMYRCFVLLPLVACGPKASAPNHGADATQTPPLAAQPPHTHMEHGVERDDPFHWLRERENTLSSLVKWHRAPRRGAAATHKRLHGGNMVLIVSVLLGCSSPTAEASDSSGPRVAEPTVATEDATSNGSTTVGTVPDSISDRGPGAWVTNDCTYEGYGYAIDILLSCGDERFDEPLRLHTFKKHSHSHGKVFSDQRITTRGERLWFDAYKPPRCVRVDQDGTLTLSERASECAAFRWEGTKDDARLVDAASGRCATLGEATCVDDRWTGGRECGGVDHRYLPLTMRDCSTALTFAWRESAETCADEYPSARCF